MLGVLWGVVEERGRDVDGRCDIKKGEVNDVIRVLLDFAKHWCWLVGEVESLGSISQ